MTSSDSIPNDSNDMKLNYDQFLAYFPDSPRKKYRNGFYVQCSAHADKNPSLLIEPSTNPDFTVKFKCFSGCKSEDILKSKGLTWDNIRTVSKHQTKSQPRQIDTTYDYIRDGNLRFQVVKEIPKSFRQRRPDGHGEWINNLEGVELFLYHNDDLPLWQLEGKPIYFPEGEKDAESLISRGFAATTASCGAQHPFLPQYVESLKDADVVILQDFDDPGKKFAQIKLKALFGKVHSLKFIELPGQSDKIKDVTDWFEAGHTGDELEALTKAAPEWTPDYEITKSLVNMANVETETIDWLWSPYIPKRRLTIIEGNPGDGKSTITLAIATAVSLGSKVNNNQFPQGRVLIMSAEDGLADTIKPKLLNMRADCSQITATSELLTLDEPGLATLEKYIQYVKPILVILDPIIAFTSQEMDINKANQVRWLMARLAKLSELYDLAFIVVRHLTKSLNSNALYRGSGSIDFTAAARSVLMTATSEETGERALLHTKCNLAAKGESIGYRLVDRGLEWTGKSEMTYRDASSENGGAFDDARAWLEQVLQSGDKESDWIFSEGKNLYNLSPATLKRAKKSLNINSYSRPELGKKGAGKWYWNLPGVSQNY